MWCKHCEREMDSLCKMCGYYRSARFVVDWYAGKKGKEEMERSKTMGIIKLLPALQYAFPEIKNAFYRIDQDTKEEFVTVTSAATVNYKFPGEGPRYNFDVCVTMDSVSAMYDDVWKECKRRFS